VNATGQTHASVRPINGGFMKIQKARIRYNSVLVMPDLIRHLIFEDLETVYDKISAFFPHGFIPILIVFL
jgi:hypothetical protein